MTPTEIEPTPGERIDHCAARMLEVAEADSCIVTACFNDITITTEGKDAAGIVDDYTQQSEARRAAYEASDEYKQRQLAAAEAHAKTEAEYQMMLASSPEPATFKDPEAWQALVEKNSADGYGAAAIEFAGLWARFMEAKISQGEKLEAVAQTMSKLADHKAGGITGFMYGWAVSALAQHWKHGEDLRRWHNLDTQIGNEGEKANETGGTLNPALLRVG